MDVVRLKSRDFKPYPVSDAIKVVAGTGAQVVNSRDVRTRFDKSLADVTPDKAGAAGHDHVPAS